MAAFTWGCPKEANPQTQKVDGWPPGLGEVRAGVTVNGCGVSWGCVDYISIKLL